MERDEHAATPEERLAALGLELPPPAPAVGNYAPWIVSRGMLHTSGQLPWIAGRLLYAGRIGAELTLEEGYAACRLGCLNAVAQMKDALGALSRVRRVVRLEGVLNPAPGFRDHPKALDGASDLLVAVFGERGRHTRMIYADHETPLGCACLIVLWAEVDEDA